MSPVTIFIFLWFFIAVAWVLVGRKTMPNHENLQAIIAIIIAWTAVVGAIYILIPEQLYSLSGIGTLLSVVLCAVYFWHKRVRKEFTVSFAQEPDAIRLREIHVIVGPNELRKTEARFYTMYVSIPKGSENAEDIHFLYKHPEPSTLFPLKTIPSTGNPVITLRWARIREEFDSHVDGFATALNDSSEARIQTLNMSAGGLPAPFVLCFAYPKSNFLYFPSASQWTYPLNQKYRFELWARAKDMPEKKLKTLLIDARAWNSVSIMEVEEAS